ncbi:hypothetical protein ABG067_004570 [Albugo candida]
MNPLWLGTQSCTGLTTADGSTLLAHTDDTGFVPSDLRLVRVPAQQHSANSRRAVYEFNAGYPRLVVNDRGPNYKPKELEPFNSSDTKRFEELFVPLGYIPQISNTYGYYDQDYGIMNDMQLSMPESTCGARTVGWPNYLSYGYNLFSINELSKIALERCVSARCAIQTMGSLAEEYGFYGELSGSPDRPAYSDSSESLAISDKHGEVWIFNILTGKNNASAVWAAQRVADDHITVIANGFTIREIDLEKPDYFMASKNIFSFCEEMGWWNKSYVEPFDFTRVYGYQGPNQKHAYAIGRRMWRVYDLLAPSLLLDSRNIFSLCEEMGWWNSSLGKPFDFTKVYGYQEHDEFVAYTIGRRMWRVYDLLAPSLLLDSRLGWWAKKKTYPFSVKPDALVTANNVMDVLKDYYQNTRYDLTKGIAAGPFGSPVRWQTYSLLGRWERPISIYRTIYSYVLQTRSFLPDAVGGIIWYGQGCPHGTVYVPFSCQQKSIPVSYLIGKQSEFSFKSSWRVFNLVFNWSLLRFDVISIDVRQRAKELQEEAFEFQKKLDNHRFGSDINATDLTYLEESKNKFAAYVVDEWWKLAWILIAKYSDGMILTGETNSDLENPGYPEWWLKLTDFVTPETAA